MRRRRPRRPRAASGRVRDWPPARAAGARLGLELALGTVRRRWSEGLLGDLGDGGGGTVFLLQRLEQPREARERVDERCVTALEERSPLLGDGLGVLEVLLESDWA